MMLPPTIQFQYFQVSQFAARVLNIELLADCSKKKYKKNYHVNC